MKNIRSEDQKQAVAAMRAEALRFVAKLDELNDIQTNGPAWGGTYQFKERAAVQRASIDLKRCMTVNMNKLYERR